MYIISVLDQGEERVFRAETVMMSETNLMISTGGEIKLFKPADLIELMVLEPIPDCGLPVILETSRLLYRKPQEPEVVN